MVGVQQFAYPSPTEPPGDVTADEKSALKAFRRGAIVSRAVRAIMQSGFKPDLICAPIGWGEPMFLKDTVPDAKLLGYCEFMLGADHRFDVEFARGKPPIIWPRVFNAPSLGALAVTDCGITPTSWQHSQFPSVYARHIRIIHDGIDTDLAVPGAPDEDLITYVARNLEPHRGFHIFMRAIPEIQRRRPKAHVVILGADDVSYSLRLPSGQNYREFMLRELEGKLDMSRISFRGWVQYPEYLKLLRRSSVHVYLTYPFVLSWSLLEAMSSGCLIVGSRTPPVEEVIEDGVNGLLVDFFSPAELAARVCEAIERKTELQPLRDAARRTVLDRYDLKRVCLPAQLNLIKDLVPGVW